MNLILEDIVFSYDKKSFIFDGLNASFKGPLLHLILGPNGVGKSTLLKIIAGILKPVKGSVTLDGKPIGGGEVSYIPQDNELLPWLTVFSNVELPLRIAGFNGERRRVRVLEALKAMGVEEYANMYPKHLSRGLKKRAALARALASNSKIILLDEPTANLDPGAREMLWDYLVKLARNKLVIAITHDVSEAIIASGLVHIIVGRPARILESFEGGDRAWEKLEEVIKVYYKTL